MTGFDGSCLKTDGELNSREGVTKQVLTGGSSDAKGSLQPNFEKCRNTSVEWHDWCMQDLQLHSLEGILLQDMVRL